VIPGLQYDEPAPYTIPDAPSTDSGLFDTTQPYFTIPMDYQNLSDSSSSDRVDYVPEEQSSMIADAIKVFKDLVAPTTDGQGRAQQSFAASVILGAANGVMSSMNQSKGIQANKDLEQQRSSNRVSERKQEEERLIAASSSMPKISARGNRSVGLLSANIQRK